MKPVLLAAALAASAALAQQPSAASRPPQRSVPKGAVNDGLDPNEMICRSESEVGSRLRRHRTCVTRAQWAEQMRQDRQLTEQAQTRRIWCGGGICPQ